MEFNHISVLLRETTDGLLVKPDGIYVDGTLGGAGHAYRVCEQLGEHGHFYGIDQDEYAIAAATERLKPFSDKITIIKSNYEFMKPELNDRGVEKVDGIMLDLGVSSYQLDTKERGFSYREDAPLDMRMDTEQPLTAKEIVNTYSEEALAYVIKTYGEERYAKN
ncbi:MAG: 16S rRNA (cytosine(1402)-N(4))-methyltransferase RsmH, partial [Lachnospiraceae bacterium]|nr:16S rRNA (cytosine(1402)-N(4))-methyltransferase RsmH [Lachnospiraceae bacterium]